MVAASRGRRGGRRRQSGHLGDGDDRRGGQGRYRRVPGSDRHRDAGVHQLHYQPGQWNDCCGALPGRPARKEGRPADRHRSAALSGHPAAGPGHAAKGRGRAGAGATGSHALSGGPGPQRHRRTDGRGSGEAGRADRRYRQERSWPGRLRSAAAGLLPHHRTDQRPSRTATGRPGECRAGQRHHHARRRDAAGADHGDFHAPGGQSRAGPGTAASRRQAECRCLGSRRSEEARDRHADRTRQPDRHDDRHGQGTRHVR